MPDRPVLLSYPDPPLADGAVVLRRWAESDLGCVEEASRDPRLPAGTIVPASFTVADGLAWIERHWGRADSGEGLSLAIAAACCDAARRGPSRFLAASGRVPRRSVARPFDVAA